MLDSFGQEVLDRDQCLRLVATVSVGRVLFTHRGLPAVQPVRFSLDEQAVWFSVPEGSVLFSAAHGNVLALEADLLQPDLATGWWVTVLGHATRAPRRFTSDRQVRLAIEVVHGRRLVGDSAA
ncbi:pyridoxamine 5'-phosphate oxidase family protein [Amycolatopsis suaedae]|uniref:Pyridoxamine 5'-phosphate oxidase family protein n=1 Tax=Amycolatopsis suaedae TaxID=2510978 RepID=A0A4Q7J9G4_9PSEU|nr:pyridoxamine 5'-phosphate oxidase family protein [Amycolatopsis suaedae]RZQ64401.1 pyridoxamine 5'-phosphate oxidase family protein [Amycolatopsis suaedae]